MRIFHANLYRILDQWNRRIKIETKKNNGNKDLLNHLLLLTGDNLAAACSQIFTDSV